MANERFNYRRYLASREWRLKRKEVIERAQNICERCGDAEIENVHHLSYERVGHENVDMDLMGVCRPCHEFLSAERDDDPAVAVVWRLLKDGGIEPLIHPVRNDVMWWMTVKATSKGAFFNLDIGRASSRSFEGVHGVVIHLQDDIPAFCWWM